MDIQIYLSALARRVFRLAPIQKNKVVFTSYYGKGYSDNPKAIAEVLRTAKEPLDLVWLLKNKQDAASLPRGIRAAAYKNPISRAWHLATAKVWVDNCRKGERCKRKGQFYLQTWHGFALKCIEKDATDALDPAYIRSSVQDSKDCDLMVAGSRFMSGIHRESFWYEGEIGLYGTPRNDVFFQDNSAVNEKVRQYFGLAPDRKILLYAPTFRDDGRMDCYNLDTPAVLDALQGRFGGSWSILCRLHPNIADRSTGLFPYDKTCVLDASHYPDMQELLLACDMLLTDYSSSMFDFALSGKPCIRFATDLELYTKDRGFYFRMEEIPFPLAKNMEELLDILQNFDENKQKERWEHFAAEQGFCEDGKASERCAHWILQKIQGASL